MVDDGDKASDGFESDNDSSVKHKKQLKCKCGKTVQQSAPGELCQADY